MDKCSEIAIWIRQSDMEWEKEEQWEWERDWIYYKAHPRSVLRRGDYGVAET